MSIDEIVNGPRPKSSDFESPRTKFNYENTKVTIKGPPNKPSRVEKKNGAIYYYDEDDYCYMMQADWYENIHKSE